MITSRLSRIVAVSVAVVAVAATASGITYAATATPTYAYGCVNSAHTLRLLSSTGTCAKGYKKVAINQQGARGVPGPVGARGATGAVGAPGASGAPGQTGATGPSGSPGPSGAPGPGALGFSVSSTGGLTLVDRMIPGMGLTVRGVCQPNADSELQIADMSAASGYDVRGTYTYSGSNGSFVHYDGTSVVAPMTGADVPATVSFSTAVQTDRVPTTSLSLVNGSINARFLVVRGTRTFTLDLYAEQAVDHCLVQGQVTPSS